MAARSGNALLAGVIGDPIAHSLSPALHEFWLSRHGINGAYVPLHVTPSLLHDTVLLLPKLGFQGFNVTLPHKEAIVPLLDEVDTVATMIGAVNTVIVEQDGQIRGTNTDAEGFVQHLRHSAPEFFGTISQKHSFILGAGGAARAILVGLAQAGCQHFTLCNRNQDRALELREAMLKHALFQQTRIDVAAWEARSAALDATVDLLVNTTQLGMQGSAPLEIDLKHLHTRAVVYDIVYRPLHTELLQQAQRQGLQVVDGLGMLLWQAQRGFRAWFGVDAEVDTALREHILKLQG